VRIFPKAGIALATALVVLSSGFSSPANAVLGPNPSPSGPVGESAETQTAEGLLKVHAAEWGIEASQFVPTRVIPGQAGMVTVRFGQRIDGIEVASSLVAITTSKSGELLSHSVTVSDYASSTQPRMTPAQANKRTQDLLGEAGNEVAIERTELVIADSALLNDVVDGQKLVWRSTTSLDGDATTIATTYLDDATGNLITSLPLVRGINTAPFVCDMQFADAAYAVPNVTGTPSGRAVDISAASLTLPLCGSATFGQGVPETVISSSNIVRTWDYFSNYLGIDINEEKYLGNISPAINGNDPAPRISAFVNVCAIGTAGTVQCPYGNAFWVPWASQDCASGACSGIFMGQNFDHADDVIAHELSHGVTYSLAFNAGLADNSETAALSEAISDIFGEAVDQLNVNPGESADPSWTLGEDVQGGGFRNMKSPNVAKIGKDWRPADSHENSGPVNKLAWLLANGGKVGKTKIKAIGTTPKNGLCTTPAACTAITNVTALTLAATSHISASASYIDFAREFLNACEANVANGTAGFNKKTCKNVGAALKAQGFTNFSVSGLTKLGKVAKNSDTSVSATLVSSTGSAFANQPAALQYKKGGKWKTIASGVTDAAGNISFTVKWSKSVSYRIASKTNGGIFEANSKAAKVKVS
jgi:hypothetical protein